MAGIKPKKIENLLNVIRECVEIGNFRDTTHAQQRQKERKIILTEILYVLKTGRHEKSKDRFDETYNTWNYAIRGYTIDRFDLRVIISFDQEKKLLIITTFHIEKRG